MLFMPPMGVGVGVGPPAEVSGLGVMSRAIYEEGAAAGPAKLVAAEDAAMPSVAVFTGIGFICDKELVVM